MALDVLETLAIAKSGQTLSDLARSAGLPKTSVHRLLYTLESEGYVWRNARTGRFNLGLRMFHLATLGLHRTSIAERVRPILYSLVSSTGLTVTLALPDHGQAVVIETIDGNSRLGGMIGRRKSLHCTGIGKALLAYMPEEEVGTVIRRGLQRFNENTIVSPKKLLQELSRIREAGYSIGDEEETIGLRCIGVPICDMAGQRIAAMSIAGTTGEIRPDNTGTLSRQICAAAQDVSRALSSHPPARTS